MIFLPDAVFGSLSEITPEYLRSAGINGLILDIDYTLAPKSSPLPDESTRQFVRGLQDGGIKLFIISNNHRERVSLFAGALGLDFICDSFKPLPSAFRKALRAMDMKKGEVAAVGDQIYTDVLGAHSAGLRALLLLEDESSRPLPYRLRRRLEKPFTGLYFRREKRRRGQ
jgi:HAD superfamily phosphatase (TIGR01668 family)